MIDGKMILSKNAATIAESRYFREGEDWEKCCNRVARVISAVETSNADGYEELFGEMIYNMDFLPAGRRKNFKKCGKV
jgi:hypothetical protein